MNLPTEMDVRSSEEASSPFLSGTAVDVRTVRSERCKAAAIIGALSLANLSSLGALALVRARGARTPRDKIVRHNRGA